MKKVLLAALAALTVGVAGPAFAHDLVVVSDPTPNGAFTGTYDADDPATAEDEGTGTQQGYIAVGEHGITACNGNENITRPDDGSALQGYVWVGPELAATNQTGASPGGEIGAGNNHQDADKNSTGASPCPTGDPAGANE